MVRHNKKLLRFLIIISLLFSINRHLSQNFSIMMPGITQELGKIIDVENGNKDYQGKILLTAVSSRSANIPLFIYGALNKNVRILPNRNLIPHDWDREQYYRFMLDWMEESQAVSKYVALKIIGLEPSLKGEGVEVTKLMSDSPALGILKEGDIIKKVNGIEVGIAEEMVDIIQKLELGENVTILLIRDGSEKEVNIKTYESPTSPGRTAIGVYIITHKWQPHLPIDIKINTGDISGPSAGLMFTLEIINQLTREDITKGRVIAGTGTIGLDGSIGEIGGADLKVISSKRDGASIFFTPMENYADALKMGKKLNIEVVGVTHINEVLEYLSKL